MAQTWRPEERNEKSKRNVKVEKRDETEGIRLEAREAPPKPSEQDQLSQLSQFLKFESFAFQKGSCYPTEWKRFSDKGMKRVFEAWNTGG